MKSALSKRLEERKDVPLCKFVDPSDGPRVELIGRLDAVYSKAMAKRRVNPEGGFYDAPDCMAAIRCIEVAAGFLGVRELELPRKPPRSLAGFFAAKETQTNAPH